MLKAIRPWQILHAVPEERRSIKTLVPGPRSGMLTLEYNVLLALEKLVMPRKILEFGTAFGETTYLLALNAPESARVWTMDLDEEGLKRSKFYMGPAKQEYKQFEDYDPRRDWDVAHRVFGKKRYFNDTPQAYVITQILGDSTTYNYSQLPQDFDFIFIDANHDYDYVKSDTLNSMKIAKKGYCCIVWHDYNRTDCPGVQKYLDELAKEKDIYHVEETRIALYLEGISILWPKDA